MCTGMGVGGGGQVEASQSAGTQSFPATKGQAIHSVEWLRRVARPVALARRRLSAGRGEERHDSLSPLCCHVSNEIKKLLME